MICVILPEMRRLNPTRTLMLLASHKKSVSHLDLDAFLSVTSAADIERLVPWITVLHTLVQDEKGLGMKEKSMCLVRKTGI